ncbi:MAG: SDR family oxidoreductase, partial [Candidatus Omnitrophota bacterium]
MRILITGGAGYIGSVLTAWALRNNYKVRALDNLWFDKKIPLSHCYNSNYEFFKVDLLKAELDDYLEDIDIIVHTAAVVGEPASRKFPELTKKVNYEASLSLIEKARNSSVKGFIFLSTCSNYGSSSNMAKEDMPLNPLSLYAETKVGVERYLMDKTQGLDWVICRLSTVYGVSPRMRFDLTINDFALNGYLNKYLDIFLPLSFRPYIHVFDVAKVILKITENFSKVKNNVFNVGFNGENY